MDRHKGCQIRRMIIFTEYLNGTSTFINRDGCEMSLNFEKVSLGKQNEYLEYFAECPQKPSDYTFLNLWGWAEVHGLYWAWSDNLVWIKQTVPDEVFWAPIGSWAGIDWPMCFDDYFDEQIEFSRIPEDLLQLWKANIGHRIIAEDARDHWDYLYAADSLIELKGRRFHKKRNLLNQFKKKYDFQFVPFGEEMIHTALAMQDDWCTWRDCESSEALSAENRAISRVLHSWEKLYGVTGGAIIIGQKMAAYTIAEKLSEDTIVIHFEKGNAAYKGVYQAINQMFLEHTGDNLKTVNREQDLGDVGLRKAKLSYNPSDFIKKYRVVLK